MIDESDVQAYVRMPDCLIKGCSDDMAIFIADGGNHFTDYGIYEGMFLFFDLNKPFLKGRLSCYINKNDDEKPKYRVSDKDIDGYEHLGRLVVTMRNYEVFTTRMCEAGVNVKVIQDALGHKDVSTTLNIYTDVTKELRKSEFEGLELQFNQ